MKKKLGIFSLLALAALVPTACGTETKEGNNDSGTNGETDELASKKSEAIIQLDNYLKEQLSIYSVTDKDQLISLGLNDYKSRINDALSAVQITNAVNSGKQYIDKQVNALFTAVLKSAKENAVKQLKNYVETRLTEENLLTTTAIESAKTNGEASINSASSISGVNTALQAAKDNIDLLINSIIENNSSTALNNLKATKLNELDNYVAGELVKNGIESNSELDEIVTNEKTKINDALTIDAVNSAFDAAKTIVDAKINELVSAKNEATELANYKNDKKTELEAYANTKANESNIDSANLNSIVIIGKSNIDSASTKALVDSALATAKSNIDDKILEILDQSAKEQLANYKNEKKAYLQTKADAELDLKGVTDDGTVSALVSSYKTKINDATSISLVDEVVNEFEGKLTEAVQTIKNNQDAIAALKSAKETAKTNIENYAKSKLETAGLTDDASVATVGNKVSLIKTTIDEKITVNDVEAAVELGKTEIDTLVASLASMSAEEKLNRAKSDAKTAISNYATACLNTNGVTDDGTVSTIVTTSNNEIDAITDIKNIDGVVASAKTQIDSAVATLVANKEALALQTAKTNAITSLENYLAAELAANGLTENVDLTSEKALINGSTTVVMVQTNLEAAKSSVDSKIQDLVAEKEAVALQTAKTNAITSLENYLAAKLTENGLTENVDLTSEKALINGSTTIAMVQENLEAAKISVDTKISDLLAEKEAAALQAAKDSAIKDINDYKTSAINEAGITDDGSVANIVAGATARINACSSINAVNEVKTTIKSEIDNAINAIKNQGAALETAKTEAIEALNAYMTSAISNAGITDDGTVNSAKNNGVAAINAATTEANVTAALTDAKAAINQAIQKIVNAELDSYKATKKSELDSYAAEQMAIYGVTDDGSINNAIEAGKNNINQAATKADVDAKTISAKSSILSAITAIVNGSQGGGNGDNSNEDLSGEVVEQGKIEVIESAGWLETGYVKFKKLSGYDSYNVYVKAKGAADSTYIKIDDMLIRDYGDYVRADMLGLRAGSYVFKVTAVKNGTEDAMSVTTCTFKCLAQEREGFAWASYSTFKHAGAYNSDGTVSSGTTIVYLTDSNIDSVQATIGGKSCTGIGAILSAQAAAAKSGTAKPLIVRIIGKINYSGNYIEAKGSSAYTNLMTTIEGVGDDAWIVGAVKFRNAGNVEVSNIAVRDFNDDGVTIDTDNCNVWVHNCDFFYGVQGSGDKAKGDGSLDCKGDSQYLSFNNNHFWDTGKVSLCGMTSETGENWISYYNNWFDHSDSRHPRVRTMSVHVYNNYYDGVAKYGVGAAKDSNVFVESNFFRSCKYPMLTSLQGNDIYDFINGVDRDKGTFSGETGGVIKAYDNHMEGTYQYQKYVAGDALKSKHFDAYEVSSRDEQVPSTVTSLSGGNKFNNFDTSSTFKTGYKYDVLEGNQVKDYVTKFAGRMYQGDFKYTFNNAVDDTNYEIDTNLRSAITNHKVNLVKVLGSTAVVTVGSSNATNTMPESVDEYTAQDFTKAVDSIGTVTYTSTCLSKINSAYSIYNQLDSATKSQVSSAYQTLEQKKAQYEALKEAAFQEEIDNTILLINAIGTVNANSGIAIQNARASYDKLSAEQKALVTNYSVLTAAEAAFEQYAVQNVINLINAIGTVTKDSKTAIDAARTAYDALTSTQKSDVTNYTILTAAEEKYATFAVIDLINAIPATVTTADASTINVARTAYDALNDSQKALVTNYEKLTAAEAALKEIASKTELHTFGGESTSSSVSVTGNTSTSKGSVTYNGTTYSTCLKMESSTSIKVNAAVNTKLTLVFGGSTAAAGKTVKIDGTTYTCDSNGIVTIDISSGSHTITKGDSINLFVIQLG